MPAQDVDPATRARLRMVYPDVATRFCRLFQDMLRVHGRRIRMTDGLRTFDSQAKLYAQGRTAPGPIVTNSKPGDSLHHYGCAFDICFRGLDPYPAAGDKIWQEYGRLAQAHGLVWGGMWDSSLIDRPHCQITYGLTLDEIKFIYRQGGLEGVWRHFDKLRGVTPGDEWYGPQTRIRLAQRGVLP